MTGVGGLRPWGRNRRDQKRERAAVHEALPFTFRGTFLWGGSARNATVHGGADEGEDKGACCRSHAKRHRSGGCRRNYP